MRYDITASPVVEGRFATYPVFTTEGIALEVKNTTSDVIEIAWDQSVYIDETGTWWEMRPVSECVVLRKFNQRVD